MTDRYRDRREAGRDLASKLQHYHGRTDVIVLGLPRGGIPVAYEVADALGAPLDAFLVRKIGVPWHEELAMGAIASGGVCVLDHDLIAELGVPKDKVNEVIAREQRELLRREQLYRRDRMPPDLSDKIVILVDDGLATGASMRAAARAARAKKPKRVVVAVPVGARQTCARFGDDADEVVCARMPEPFNAVGLWYDDFDQTSDDEVTMLLQHAASRRALPGTAGEERADAPR